MGADNSLKTIKQVQEVFSSSLSQLNKTIEEQNRQIQNTQQELIKTMKRQEKEEKAREKDEKSSVGFDQMLSGFLPLLGQLAGQSNQQRVSTPAFTPSNVKPFQPNRNIKTDRG